MITELAPVPFTIFLAEDDLDDCLFFKEALKEFSVPKELTVVHDGEQLMKLLTDETNGLHNILFLDLNLPRKNGFECLSEIKHNKKLKEFPLIIYFTTLYKKIAISLYETGASYYISKLFEISKLKKVVQEIITRIAQQEIHQRSKETFLFT